MINKDSAEISHASIKNGLILALFALVSTGLIVLTHFMTKDRIALEIEAAMARQLSQVIATDEYDNNVYRDCVKVSQFELLGSTDSNVYRMRNQQKNYAVFMTSVAPDGYAGKINLVVGIYAKGKIAGVRITEHQETPGLGDKIEIKKSDWIKQFDGKSLANTIDENWLVKKDGGSFDALTGATITPRAIIKAVHNSLLYYQQNLIEIYAQPTSCGKIE